MKKKATKSELNKMSSEYGRRGGKAIAKRGKKYMQSIGKAGAQKRWSGHKKVGKD